MLQQVDNVEFSVEPLFTLLVQIVLLVLAFGLLALEVAKAHAGEQEVYDVIEGVGEALAIDQRHQDGL